MDKETLSNYGWIVICVLVLAVMIALATPFGSYIKDAVWYTTNGFFDVNSEALGAVNISITSPDDNGGVDYEVIHKPTGDVLDSTQTFTMYGYDLTTYTFDEYECTEYKSGEWKASIRGMDGYLNRDAYAINYGPQSKVVMSKELLGITCAELQEYQVVVTWPEGYKTVVDFSMKDYTHFGETISVPVITYNYYDIDGTYAGSSDAKTLWVLDTATKTFHIGTPNTVNYENMVFYVDCYDILWDAATSK